MASGWRHGTVVLLVGAALAGVGWLLLGRTDPPAASVARHPDGARSISDADPPAASAATEPCRPAAPARRRDPSLRLRIFDSSGKPTRGRACWVTSEAAPWLPPFLVPDLHRWLPARARQQDVPGETRIDLVRGRWTWLYVRWDGPSLAGRLARIAPFEGERTLELRADPGRKAVHAFVVRSDLSGPVPHGEIVLHAMGDMPVGGPGGPGRPRRIETDAHGYARIELPAGHHLLRAPGAEAAAGAPHTARLHLSPTAFPTELTVVLVQPEPRAILRLLVEAPGDFAPEKPARAYLERKGDGSGVIVPVPGRVRAGRQEHTLQLVPGTYRFATIPVGLCRVVGGQEIVEASAGRSGALVRVAASAPTVTVELYGLSLPQLPVSVFAEPADGIVDCPPDLLHWGPRTWHRARQEVSPLTEPCRLVVRHRGTYRLSRDVLVPGQSSYAVELEPATRIDIAWTFDGAVPAAGTVVAETPQGTSVRSVRRELDRAGGIVRPALRGALVVPEGHVTLTGQAGRHAFHRTVEACGTGVRLDVGRQLVTWPSLPRR